VRPDKSSGNGAERRARLVSAKGALYKVAHKICPSAGNDKYKDNGSISLMTSLPETDDRRRQESLTLMPAYPISCLTEAGAIRRSISITR